MANPAAMATSFEDTCGDGRWMSMHQRFIIEAKEKEPEVLIVGDFLMQFLQQDELWEKLFVPLHCLNFGIESDQTQHVLWRLENGELEDFAPKVIVICCGTNNYEHSVDQIVEGILSIVKTCQQKQPQAQVIVMAIPPRGQYDNPLRQKISQINNGVAYMIQKMQSTTFLDVDPAQFINPSDGSISHDDMFDYLHFTKLGYRKLAEPLLEEIQTYLKNFLSVDTLSCSEAEI